MSICSFSFYTSIYIANSPISIFTYIWISTRCSCIAFGACNANFSIFSSIGSVHISSTSCFCSFPNVVTIFSIWWCITSFGSSSIIPSAWYWIRHNIKSSNAIFFFNRLGISRNCNCWGGVSSYFKATANRQTVTA